MKSGQKISTDTSIEGNIDMKITIWKGIPHPVSLGNYKLRRQWDTTLHPLEWLSLQTLTTPNTGENVKQQKLPLIAGGHAKCYNHIGSQFGISYKAKHTHHMTHHMYLPKWLQNLSSHRKCCTWLFIVALFIIAKIWKQSRCYLADEWISKLWYIQVMEYYLLLKRIETLKL